MWAADALFLCGSWVSCSVCCLHWRAERWPNLRTKTSSRPQTHLCQPLRHGRSPISTAIPIYVHTQKSRHIHCVSGKKRHPFYRPICDDLDVNQFCQLFRLAVDMDIHGWIYPCVDMRLRPGCGYIHGYYAGTSANFQRLLMCFVFVAYVSFLFVFFTFYLLIWRIAYI